MKLIIIIITFLWLCFGGWLIYFYPKDFKIYSVAISGLVAFLYALLNYYQSLKKEQPTQIQKIKSNSYGIQVGGNLNINQKEKE